MGKKRKRNASFISFLKGQRGKGCEVGGWREGWRRADTYIDDGEREKEGEKRDR